MELRWDGVPSLADACACSRSRRSAPRAAVGAGRGRLDRISVRRAPECRPSMRSTRRRPRPPRSCCTCTTGPSLTARRFAPAVHQGHARPARWGDSAGQARGNPTGLLIARPNAMILYATLAKGPKLPYEDQVNSTRHFMRELNRLASRACVTRGAASRTTPTITASLANSPSGANSLSGSPTTSSPSGPSKKRGLRQVGEDDQAGRRQRLLPHEWRRRDAGLFGGGFRGLPRTRPDLPSIARSRTQGSRHSLGAEPLAFRIHAPTTSRSLAS